MNGTQFAGLRKLPREHFRQTIMSAKQIKIEKHTEKLVKRTWQKLQ